MSGDITMIQVIEALGELYYDDGVAMYLAAPLSFLPMLEDGSRHQTGIEACQDAQGRFMVWQRASALVDGAFA
jgi:hypothetical protein